jgi:hypothetical protein
MAKTPEKTSTWFALRNAIFRRQRDRRGPKYQPVPISCRRHTELRRCHMTVAGPHAPLPFQCRFYRITALLTVEESPALECGFRATLGSIGT